MSSSRQHTAASSMDIRVDKSTTSSTLTQTDLVTSPILCQCLYVIKTVSEFGNLTYRITKTHNDMEVLVVFREGVLGVFGPPVEPISLTLDPKGRCLLTVLFKPVERVSIVSPDSSQIKVASLLAMLRLISGKGYVFCPGFPEKFVIGKACGRFIVLHKIPFKRYQSTHCLVYYKGQAKLQGQTNPSMCALCPRCLHAAKCIYALPMFASDAGTTVALPMFASDASTTVALPMFASDAGTTVALPMFASDAGTVATLMPTQSPNAGHLKSAQRSTDDGDSYARSVTPATGDRATGSQHPGEPRPVTHTACLNNSVTPFSNPVPTTKQQGTPALDVNGNTAANVSFTDHKTGSDRWPPESRHVNVNARIQVLTQVLTNLMQVQCPQKSLRMYHMSPDLAGMKTVSRKAKKTLSDWLEKGSHGKTNVCHHCKKQYSSPTKLLSHLQRHEALPGAWHSKFRHRKQRRMPTVFSVVHRMFHESKLPVSLSKQRPAVLSEMSVRLFLQYLDDLISQSETRSLEQQGYNPVKLSAPAQNRKNLPTVANCMQMENGGILEPRCSLKRTNGDFSPMHTLLQAAAIAEVGQIDQNHLFIPTPAMSGRDEEAPMSSILQTPSDCLQVASEDCVPQKKPRKSSRLASKRARDGKTRVTVEDCYAEAASEEQCMLTNLNLLSTVSLETAMRQAASHSTVISSSNSPTVACPVGRKLSSIVAQNVLNNTSGGNIVIGRCQEAMSYASAETSSSLPPVPPLLFAGDAQGKGLQFPLSQQQQGQSQTARVSTSALRSLISDISSRRMLSDTKNMKSSPSASCGAIDLSKPKRPATASISLVTENTNLRPAFGLPHHMARQSAGDNSCEALQCFMLMAKSAGITEQGDGHGAISDKQADSDLQTRMFASARNYRLDTAAAHSAQVQAVIASSSQTIQSGKALKSGVQDDEIQCGYKWSGSGGLVKERTQMVRELVPSDVMASYLTKPPPLQPSNSSICKIPQPGTQIVPSSMAGWPTQTLEPSASELALNLMTSRLTESPSCNSSAAGRNQKATGGVALSASVLHRSPTSPGSLLQNILRSSIASKSAVVSQRLQSSSDIAGSPQKMLILPLTPSSTPTSSSSTSTVPAHCTVSSPSLAAMLCQSSAVVGESNNSLNSSSNFQSSPVSVTYQHILSTDTCPVLSLPSGVHIKNEPAQSDSSTEQAPLTSGLPVKSQHAPLTSGLPIKSEPDLGTEDLHLQGASGSALSSVNNVTNDGSPETRLHIDTDQLKPPPTETKHIATKNTSVRCKH
ncbi:hypothetical protein BsWGS_27804 [Bradybaena similaris]